MTEIGFEADTAARLGAWLLDMGFPRSTSREHLLTICRGNYRTVWESLMKQIKPRAEVRNQRRQVFLADINHSKSFEDDVHQRIGFNVTCEELEVWRETQILRKQMNEAECRISAAKDELVALNTLLVSEKISQRLKLCESVTDMRRQSCALQAAANQFQTRADRLSEMINITEKLAPFSIPTNVVTSSSSVVQNCLALLSEMARKRAVTINKQEGISQLTNKFNSTAISNSSTVSDSETREQETTFDAHDRMLQLLEGIGLLEAWDILHKKQDDLIESLINSHDTATMASADHTDSSQSIIAETSALHCKLALRTIDMKRRVDDLKTKLVYVMKETAIDNEDETARELLVLQCEEAAQCGRVSVLQEQLSALQQRSGDYKLITIYTEDENIDQALANITAIDKELLTKKSEIEALLMSTEHMSSKIGCVITQLESLLLLRKSNINTQTKLHDISTHANYDEFVRHFRPNAPDDSMSRHLAHLKEFYSTTHGESSELSLNFDCSVETESTVTAVPRLIDEIKFFIEQFNLSDNRKLVLLNGESLWISEIVENNSQNKCYTISHEIALKALSVKALANLAELSEVALKMREPLGWKTPLCINIKTLIEFASERLEQMKKIARNSITALQQTTSQLDVGLENLKWWEAERPNLYISDRNSVFGKTYSYYESVYKEFMRNRDD